MICVLLVIQGVISFRSVPRVLNVLKSLGYIALSWIPDFSSVIHWQLRVGVFLLKQAKNISNRWIAIIDTSIDIGTKKALVVLRVPVDTFARVGKALTLADCECLAIKISSVWNGETVASALSDIFSFSGCPVAILKDGGSDLKKGVNTWRKQGKMMQVWVIEDVGHIVANALKSMFAKCELFKTFLKAITIGSRRIRQTKLCFFLPPKIRTKGRFQGIGRVAVWAQMMLDSIGQTVPSNTELTQIEIEKLRSSFLDLFGLDFFLTHFISTCRSADQFLKLMKNEGLNQKTYREGKEILTQFRKGSIIHTVLHRWLEKTMTIQCRLAMGQTPLPVSSDIIESLFGKFKTIVQRCPQGEINRLVLTIPTMCGEVDSSIIEQALKFVSHQEMKDWIQKNIPQTLKSQKRNRLESIKIIKNYVPETGKAA